MKSHAVFWITLVAFTQLCRADIEGGPEIRSFFAEPAAIVAGGSTTLVWDVVDAEDILIDPGVGSVGGTSITVMPEFGADDEVIYGLVAIDHEGNPSFAEARVRKRDPSPVVKILVTEIMYNPVVEGTEFVELQNVGETVVDLSGARFFEGIEFEFPAGINPLSPRLRSLQRRPQAPHAKSKFLAAISRIDSAAGSWARAQSQKRKRDAIAK